MRKLSHPKSNYYRTGVNAWKGIKKQLPRWELYVLVQHTWRIPSQIYRGFKKIGTAGGPPEILV